MSTPHSFNSTPATLSPLALAIDVGGTKVEAALIDDAGAVLAGSRHRAPTGSGSSREVLADAVRRVIDQTMAIAPVGRAVVGAGIGSAGPISIPDGTVSPLNLPSWRNYPLHELVAHHSGLGSERTVLRLDGLCILLAEYWLGALRGYRNAMGMVVSTGIGGGLILEGRLIGGRSGNAGHIGQLQVRSHSGAGRDLSSTLEGMASGPRIVDWARQHGWPGSTGEELAADYREGSPLAIAAVQRCARAIGTAIASASALLDLEAVAIGGGFARITPDLFRMIQLVVEDTAALDTIRGIDVVPAALADEGPLIGAAGLVHRSDLLPNHSASASLNEIASSLARESI
ncbi:ROK family protein [Psychromicrobium sp. YIM B11713]|uniref:ROK family protein n=1 Tax=Psychromicrobium sp. YIM B11713 TaxID=3145233 RepID=UPI00374F307A